MKRYLVTGCAGFIASKVTEMPSTRGIRSRHRQSQRRLRSAAETVAARASAARTSASIGSTSPTAALAALRQRRRQPAGGPIRRSSIWPPGGVARASRIPGLLRGQRRWSAQPARPLPPPRREKFILASTSSLYGAHNPVPFAEDADTNRPLALCRVEKGRRDALLHLPPPARPRRDRVPLLHGLRSRGPARHERVSLLPLDCRGPADHGIRRRHAAARFTYVDDIARGTIAGLAPLGYEVINLGGDRPVRLDRIIHLVSEMSGREPAIEHRPAPSGRRARYLGPCRKGATHARLAARSRNRRGAAALRGLVSREPRAGLRVESRGNVTR